MFKFDWSGIGMKKWLGGFKRRIEKNFVVVLLFGFLVVWLSMYLAKPVNLINTDLGRHIENGRYFFEEGRIPATNLYSYTFPDAPFINHHWGSGVIFYLLWLRGGLGALSLFYIALSLLTFSLFFLWAKKETNWMIATTAAVVAIPLIGERTEIRPEIFSYFFSALFFFLLWSHARGKLNKNKLLYLPLLSIFWVNLHIYFFFGLGLVGLFFLDAVRRKDFLKSRELGGILFLTVGAACLNPFGWKGFLYPLGIFGNYGYRVLENQSVWFLDQIGFVQNPNLLIFKIVLFLLAGSFLGLFWINRKKIDWPLLGLGMTVSLLGWSALRNFSLFGYFVLPILAYNLYQIISKKSNPESSLVRVYLALFALMLGGFFCFHSSTRLWLEEGMNSPRNWAAVDQAAVFFRQNEIRGPIFNNYDIGSYLIFHLFPQERVFVDNRPEAYPEEFFQNEYIPMQENVEIWSNLSEKYAFNVIFFYVGDLTNWGQAFLVSRIKDADWVPVYADQYAIIFLKRNTQNENLIKRFEIPQSKFSIIAP